MKEARGRTGIRGNMNLTQDEDEGRGTVAQFSSCFEGRGRSLRSCLLFVTLSSLFLFGCYSVLLQNSYTV